MGLLSGDPFETLFNLQEALESFRSSGWLETGPSGAGPYPPVNVCRDGEDFLVIREVPGIKKSDLNIEVKGSTVVMGISVVKNDVSVNLENDVLSVEGKIDSSKYDGLDPVYTGTMSATTCVHSPCPARSTKTISMPSWTTASLR
jgi:HSP20 family molecular chaperone IbpA